MGNVFNIAKKEFADLLNNRMVLFILAFYLLLILNVIWGFSGVIDSLNSPTSGRVLIGNGDLSVPMSISLYSILVQYGLLVGVVLGVSLIASERKAGALNTLIVKPLYRDTIINGKLLAATGFLVCLFGMASALYTAAIIVFYGNTVSGVLSSYFERLPVVLLLAIVYVMIFLLLSMLMSILVRSQAFALILGMLITYISQTLISSNFAGTLPIIISRGDSRPLESAIASLSPDSVINVNSAFFRALFDPSMGVVNVVSSYEADIVRILIFFGVSLALCYIAFIRRDIA